MNTNRPIDAIAIVVTVILCASWGYQNVAIKLALPEMGPLGQGTFRSIGATILVSIFMLQRLSRSPWKKGVGTPGLVAGLLFGIEFILLFVAVAYTDASRAVMFLYVAPFVVAIGGHFFIQGERMDLKSSIGVALAFAGVAVALNPGTNVDFEMLKGDVLALAAGIFWGLTTLVIRGTELRTAPAAQVLWYQLVVSAVMFSVAGWWYDDTMFVDVGPVTMASLLYQTIWVVAITYAVWFALIARYSATSLSVITFLTPLFGAAMGHVFLGEELTSRHMIGVIAVAIGIMLVSMRRSPRGPAAAALS